MIPRLQHLFDLLETDRQQLFAEIRRLSDDDLQWHPPGKWSISQIISHVITAEKISAQYIKKKVIGITETGDTGGWEEIKIILLKISQRLPFRFKAPRVVVENTIEYKQLDELEAAWTSTRQELRELLETFKEKETKRKIYKHVRAGKLNISHALIFFRDHYIHHQPQINRLIAAKKSAE